MQRIGQEQCGIVIDSRVDKDRRQKEYKVWWGTRTAVEGRPGIRVEEWIPAKDLEPFPHDVKVEPI